MEEEIKVEIGEIIIIEAIIDKITETDQEADGTIIGQMIGVIISKLTIEEVIKDQIVDKMLNAHLEIEVKVEIELEITMVTIREVEVEIEIMTGLFSQDKVQYLVEEMNLGLGPTFRMSTNCDHVRCYRCKGYDHFASECPNIPTDEEPDYDDADPASLHMMTQALYHIDSKGEIEYLNL